MVPIYQKSALPLCHGNQVRQSSTAIKYGNQVRRKQSNILFIWMRVGFAELMNITLKHLFSAALVSGTALLALTGCGSSDSDSGAQAPGVANYVAEFTSDGALVRPENYREWVYVGTPLTPNDMNNGKAPFPEFHNVYIAPNAWEHYKKTGNFPEGTTMVKELVSVGSKQAVSGAGYFMGDFIGLEATIKSKEHFPDEPGNWAYFSFGHEYPLADTAKAFPSQSCNACHAASAADDFVFTQYYPVLRAGKGGVAQTNNTGAEELHDGEKCEHCQAGLRGIAETAEKAEQPSAETPVDTAGSIPTGKEELFKFLTDGKYKEFPAKESAKHPSAGPHSITGTFGMPVQAYLNSIMDDSLKAGNKSHPEGAGIVKEMFSKDGDLQGWAVSLKTQKDSDGGNGWFWYEVTSTKDSSALVAHGNGVALCAGCHSSSKSDFVLTGFPLK